MGMDYDYTSFSPKETLFKASRVSVQYLAGIL
jgi:hypothetical protein